MNRRQQIQSATTSHRVTDSSPYTGCASAESTALHIERNTQRPGQNSYAPVTRSDISRRFSTAACEMGESKGGSLLGFHMETSFFVWVWGETLRQTPRDHGLRLLPLSAKKAGRQVKLCLFQSECLQSHFLLLGFEKEPKQEINQPA